jgi:hypothetical protein
LALVHLSINLTVCFLLFSRVFSSLLTCLSALALVELLSTLCLLLIRLDSRLPPLSRLTKFLITCKDGLAFRLGSERKRPHRSARRPRVDSSFFLCHFVSLLASRLYSHPPSRLDHRRKMTANKSHPIPLSQPPASPFLPLSFPCTLGNDDHLSAAAARHSYTPALSLIDFPSFSLTFSLFFFLHFS